MPSCQGSTMTQRARAHNNTHTHTLQRVQGGLHHSAGHWRTVGPHDRRHQHPVARHRDLGWVRARSDGRVSPHLGVELRGSAGQERHSRGLRGLRRGPGAPSGQAERASRVCVCPSHQLLLAAYPHPMLCSLLTTTGSARRSWWGTAARSLSTCAPTPRASTTTRTGQYSAM